MSDEKNKSRISIEDLPQPEQELTSEEAKEVKGGLAAESQSAGDTLEAQGKIKFNELKDTVFTTKID